MTELAQNVDTVIKNRLGIEGHPYKKRITVEGRIILNIWRFFQPQTILDEKIHTVICVFNQEANKIPFIELFKSEFKEEQVLAYVNKFKEDPLSFNNQKNG